MRNIIKVFFGSIFPKIFIFGLNVLLARSLSLSEFGLYSYVKSFYNYFETTISSALNPFAISRLLDGEFSQAQFFALYLTYGLLSSLLAILVFGISISKLDFSLLVVLFGGVLGSILNAFLYVILINKQRGDVILFSTFFSAITLFITITLFSINSALLAVFIALSFNVIDMIFKLLYFLRKKGLSDIKLPIDFGGIPLKPSLFLMTSLMVNGGVFLFQRHLLATKQNGFQQMAYLEVSMQLYALITILLTALANGLMRENELNIAGSKIKGIDALGMICAVISLMYSLAIIIFSENIAWIYQVEVPVESTLSLCLMIITYAFAFFSVRLVILKDKQKLNLYSTLVASILCFVVYFFVNISAYAIVLSYCIFFLFLGSGNFVLLRVIKEKTV